MSKLLTGSVLESRKTKVYNHWPDCSPPNCQTGCRYHQLFYKLKVKLENKPIKTISVFIDKLTKKGKVLPILENHTYLDKRYSFACVTHYGNYHLVDWEELPNQSYEQKT